MMFKDIMLLIYERNQTQKARYWMAFHFMDIPCLVYPLICWWTFGGFPTFGLVMLFWIIYLISELHFYNVGISSVQLLSHVRLCDPMDYSLPGSSIHGSFQARVLEWGAIAFSNFIHSKTISKVGVNPFKPRSCALSLILWNILNPLCYSSN